MATTLRSDLTFRVGDTFTGPVWAVVVAGAPVDLADGWTVRAQTRLRPGDPTVLMEWSTANGRVLLGSATVPRSDGSSITTSTVQLTHPAAAASALVPFVGRYDCEITDGTRTHTITDGTVVATRDVTR